MQMYNPPHPGLVLKDALANMPMSETALAELIDVSQVLLSRILSADAQITADISARLGKAFGQSPGLWLRMQVSYDSWQASRTTTTQSTHGRYVS